MSNTLGKGSLLLSANTGALAADLTKARGLIGGFAVKAGANITAFFGGLSAGVTAGLAALSNLTDGISQTIERISDMNDAANSLGIAVEAFQGLAHAASLSGVGVEGLTTGLNKMTQTMGQALSGSASAVAAFANIGISVSELQGKSPEQVLALIADALAGISNPAERAAAAMEIFGRGGTRMIPMLLGGSEGLRALQEEAAALGLVLGAEAVANIDELGDSLDKLKGAGTGAMNILTAALAPALTDIVNEMIEGWKELRPAIDSTAAALGDLFNSLAPAAISIFGAFKEMLPIIQMIGVGVGVTANAVGFLVSRFYNLGNVLLGGVFAALKALKPAWDAIFNSGPVKTLVGWINNIVKAVQSLVAFLRTLPGIGNIIEFIAPSAPGAAAPASGGPLGASPLTDAPGSAAAKLVAGPAIAARAFAAAMGEYGRAINAITVSAEEAAIASLEMAGGSRTQIHALVELIAKYKELKAAADLKKAIEGVTTSLNLSIATFGMTADAITLYTLSLKGASAADLANIKTAMNRLEGLKAHAELMKSGAALTEKYKSPAAKLADELKHLEEMFQAGAISADVYALATQDAMKTAAKALGLGEIKTAQAALQGSAEATSAIIKHQLQGQLPALSLESILRASNQIQAATLGTARAMLTELKASGRRTLVGVV